MGDKNILGIFGRVVTGKDRISFCGFRCRGTEGWLRETETHGTPKESLPLLYSHGSARGSAVNRRASYWTGSFRLAGEANPVSIRIANYKGRRSPRFLAEGVNKIHSCRLVLRKQAPDVVYFQKGR
jgi:hypothetical protein